MRLTLATSIVALVASAAATPKRFENEAGMAIPITKRSSWLLKPDGSVNFAALDSHIASARARIRNGLANFERNTGSVHPATVQKRGNGAPEPLSDVNSELWYGTVSIGTPPQEFTLAFSTASSDLVVPLSTCDSTCSGHTLWDVSSSSTASDESLTFSISYGDGTSTSGEVYHDSVSIAGFTATGQTICAANTYSPSLQSNYFPPDGVLGMAFPPLAAYNANPLMETLTAQSQIDPVFSFSLTSSGGELYVGGTNNALYTGDFVYVPVLNSVPSFWNVQLDFIEANGKTLVDLIDAVIDTSTTTIIGDSANVTSLYNTLGGTAASSYGAGYYTFPCDSFPNIALWFGMTDFPISPSSLNLGPVEPGSSDCLSGIVADQNSGSTSWIIGDVFLMGVYTTFDLANSQVGFATLA